MSNYILKDTNSKDIVRNWLIGSMKKYAQRSNWAFFDEDSLCEAFLSAVSGNITTPTASFSISGYKVRGRGPNAPEKKLGADGIGIFRLDTAEVSLSGFFLYQAKKTAKASIALSNVCSQSKNMLLHSSASQVMILMPKTVVFVGAMAASAVKIGDPSLQELPYNSFPQFIVEQMLRGLMLAPLHEIQAICSQDLRTEINHILVLVASEPEHLENVKDQVVLDIADLNLDVEEIIFE